MKMTVHTSTMPLKRLWIIIGMFLIPLLSLGQQGAGNVFTISGKILDSLSGKPVIYATIVALDEQQNNLGATYSDEKGVFSMKLSVAGRHKLEVSSVNYGLAVVPVSIDPGTSRLQLKPILLAEIRGYLQEVTVSTRKRLVEQKPGMLLYNAENDITNKGGTAADVLRKAPILNVDAQGNVSMRGNSNIKILINGKYSGQMARSPADALNMIPADIIKSVEVITTPSARYDAEGAAGVINIITKKGNKNTSGTLETAISNWEQMFNPRISVGKDRWNMTLNGHLHRLTRKSTTELKRINLEAGGPTLQLDQDIYKRNSAPHGSADIVVDYNIDSSSELNLGINFRFGNWPDDSRLKSRVSLPDGNITEQYLQRVTTRAGYLGSDINLGYTKKFNRPGQEMILLAQVSPSRDLSRYNSFQTGEGNALLYREQNDGETNNNELTLQADYLQPFSKDGKNIFETGVKMIRRKVDNDYLVAASSPQQPELIEPQLSRSDIFKYSQNVLAAYMLGKITMKDDWYAEVGARLEETAIEGLFVSAGTRFTNRFTNFIPTATVSKKIADGHVLNLSYTKRLTRPYIWDLNPNANTSDPKNIVSGNPELQPEIAHQAELSYGLTTPSDLFVNTSLFYKRTNNAIVDFTQTDAAGISLTNKQNLASNQQYGLNISSSIPLSAKASLNGNVNINHLNFDSKGLQIVNEGWAADINLNATYKLPNHFALQGFGEYSSRTVTLQGTRSLQYYYSMAVKRQFTSSKITVTLSTVNPFSNYIGQTEAIRTFTFSSNTYNRYYNRAVKLTVNWEFGGMMQFRERKKITNDDLKTQGQG